MKKFVIAPDKFKGSLSAAKVCDAVGQGILKRLPDAQILKLPLADGGEGSLDALENTLHFKRVHLRVSNPLFKPIKAYYGLSSTEAYIELAMAAGLQLLDKSRRNPMHTTSLGVGEMVRDAIIKGAQKIYLFVGGSATNDGGMGIASALGHVFIDKDKRVLKPIGANLIKICAIDSRNAISLEGVSVKVLTDVNNPLYGKNGAAHVFAAQKGAGIQEISQLDKGLRNFANILRTTFNNDVSAIAGGGAAGGIAAGMSAFCKAKISSGIETILDFVDFNTHLRHSDWVITGEGLLDTQTLHGKVVKGVLDRCKQADKPLALVCGDVSLTDFEREALGVSIIKPIRTAGVSQAEAMQNAYALLVRRAEELAVEVDRSNE